MLFLSLRLTETNEFFFYHIYAFAVCKYIDLIVFSSHSFVFKDKEKRWRNRNVVLRFYFFIFYLLLFLFRRFYNTPKRCTQIEDRAILLFFCTALVC